jgi:outer membrane receptor protein involved in Fe transport
MLEMKPIARAVRVALGLAPVVVAMPMAAQAQEAIVEEVVVTGSRIQKANLVQSSPVTQLDAEQIEYTGITRTEDLLRAMPQVALDQDSGQSIEAEGTATLQLRNLGNSRTLVLVDGKRLPISSPTAQESGADLNFIPAALIKRVEVLTGGASSTYGSDAVAGVVNFIMYDDFEGVKLDVQTSTYRHDNQGNVTTKRSDARGFPYAEGSISDGEIQDATFMIGGNLNDGRGNVTGYATYRDIEPVTQSERDYSACALGGGTAACGGSATSAFGTFISPNGNYNVVGTNFVRDSAATRYNFAPPSYYQRPDERYTLGAFAHYDVSEQVTVYTQLMFMDDRTVAQFAPAGMFFDFGVDIRCDNPLLSAQQATTLGCAAPAQVIEDVYIGRRNVEGGPRFGDLRHSTYRGVFGMRGEINETWRYDVSYQYAEVDMRNRNGNYVDTDKLARALDPVVSGGQVVCRSVIDGSDPACVPWNIYTTGGVTSDQTSYFGASYYERGTTDQTVTTAYVQGSLGDYGVVLPWADNGVEVVVGIESREENLDYEPDDISIAGDLGGLAAALVPIKGRLEVQEFFAEASVPIVEGRDWAELVSIDLGYRYSDYDPDNTADTWKITGNWAPIDDIRFRGGFQRAIRAANIIEMFQPVQGTLFDMADDPCADVNPATGLSGAGYSFAECARSGVTQAVWNAGGPQSSPAEQYNTVIGGSVDLEPEESDTWTVGFVFTPDFVEGLTVSLDYYDIKIDGAISEIEQQTTLTECIENSQFCDKVHRGPQDTLWLGNASPTNGIEAFYQNIGYYEVKGIDLEASYAIGIGDFGSLNFSTLLGYVDSWEQEEYSGAGAEECQGTYGGSCGTPTPELRNRFTTTWLTPWNASVNLTWRYIDEVEHVQSNSPVDIDSFNYFDVSGIWDVTSWASVRAGVNNLLDEEPPITDNGVTARNNGNTYTGIYDHLGQYWFLGGSVHF